MRPAEQVQRRDRVGGPPLDEQVAGQADGRDGDQSQDLAGAPAIPGAASDGDQQRGRAEDGDCQAAGQVGAPL